MPPAALQILRMAAVIALLGAAATAATPKGRLPLALRGLSRALRRDGAAAGQDEERVPAWRRALALALVAAAVLAAAL